MAMQVKRRRRLREVRATAQVAALVERRCRSVGGSLALTENTGVSDLAGNSAGVSDLAEKRRLGEGSVTGRRRWRPSGGAGGPAKALVTPRPGGLVTWRSGGGDAVRGATEAEAVLSAPGRRSRRL